jgi:hypothetical protein
MYAAVNMYERLYGHKYFYRFAFYAEEQREGLQFWYLQKKLTPKSPCDREVTLGKSCTTLKQ